VICLCQAHWASAAATSRLAAGGGATEREWRRPWRYKCVIRPAQNCAACVCRAQRRDAGMGGKMVIGKAMEPLPEEHRPAHCNSPVTTFGCKSSTVPGVGRLLITQSRSQAAGTVLHLVDASVAAVLSLCSEMRWATRNGAASSLGRFSAIILVSIESLNQHWSTPSASPGSRCHRYQIQAK
jgi:hypothetical protein